MMSRAGGIFERRTGQRLNANQIVSLKAWLRRVGFKQPALVIVFNGERNLIYLRVDHGNETRDIEALWLDDLRREKLSAERAYARIVARCGEAVA